MPELPEVETIKNDLSHYITGRRITGVTIIDARLVQQPGVELFCSELTGQTISMVTRRGKYLIFSLSGGKVLIMHLMMSGSLLFNPEAYYDRSARAIFYFDNGSRLLFIDRRRLGRAWLSDNADSITGKLGIDPLSAEFTTGEFTRMLKGHNMPIKAFLLDQGYIAGVGNMYADEALYAARIHPLKTAGKLSFKAAGRLRDAIVHVLRTSIESKGASVDTYQRPGGELGSAHFNFHVAHKKGDTCTRCGTPIQRIAVRNRGTYFCSYCQKR
jgi:formamidopyrimidine-DNA glycosylase